MKSDIHPEYFHEAAVTCSCGYTWVTGSTQESISTDLCSRCHPFYTGEQRIVDTEGQVERFYRKLEAQQQHVDTMEVEESVDEVVMSEVSLEEIGLTKRAVKALVNADIHNASDVMEVLNKGGEDKLLSISGFGRKSLIDLKKSLRSLDIEV